MAHYRSPIDWTEVRAVQANTDWKTWSHVLQSYYSLVCKVFPRQRQLRTFLSDDLDTPNALTVIARFVYSRAKKGSQERYTRIRCLLPPS